jgi:hypothetical protein
MWERHPGKMRHWFSLAASWRIVLLDLPNDFYNLVFLESKWTLDEGLVIPGAPNYRVLRRVAENAIAGKYLARASAQHRAYYEAIASGALSLKGKERVAICSAEDSERKSNPMARYYLLDGVGRALPYMILLLEKKLEYRPLEAFLAETRLGP